jgi:hypothetical protein
VADFKAGIFKGLRGCIEKMKAIAKSPPQTGFVDRPIGIVLILLAIAAAWGLAYNYISLIILAVIAFLLFLGLSRPVWAMAALIVHQCSIVSFMIDTPFQVRISLQLLLMIFIGLIVWRAYRQGYSGFGPAARSLILLAFALFIIAMVSDIVNSGWAVAFDDFRDWAVGLMIVSLMPIAIRDSRDLKILCGAALICITASAAIGLLQHYNILGMQSRTLLPGLDVEFRVPGMSEGPLELSYLVSIVMVILIGVFLFKGISPRIRWMMPFFLLVMAGALYFTYTRSSFLAAAFGLLALFVFIRTRLNGAVVMAVLLALAAFLMISPLAGQYFSGRSEDVQADSTVSRQILWQAGVNIALDHPILGIGMGNFSSVSPDYQANVDRSLIAYEKREYWGYRTLGSEPPHNDFINIWLSYGTLALIVFVGLFFLTISNLLKAFHRSRSTFVKGVSVGLAAALVSYGVNAIYHNMIATMPLFWIIAGLSLALAKLVWSNQSANVRYPIPHRPSRRAG